MGRINTTITNPSDTISTTISSVQGINDISFTSSGTVTATINPDTIIQTTISDSATSGGGTTNTFRDTANVGSLLGVDFTDTSGVVTATVDASGLTVSGTAIRDWNVLSNYVEDEVTVYTTSGANNVYRALNAITSNGMPLASHTAAAEQGTITVDNAAMVGAGSLGSPEIVTLTVSGNTGTDGIAPVNPLGTAGFLDLGDTFIVAASFSSSNPIFSNPGAVTHITFPWVDTNGLALEYQDLLVPSFNLSASSAQDIVTTVNTYLQSNAIDFLVDDDRFGTTLRLNSTALNPDDSDEILFNLEVINGFAIPMTAGDPYFTIDGTDRAADSGSGRFVADLNPAQLRIVTGSIDETLTLTGSLTTQAAIAADIVTQFNANANLGTIFANAMVNTSNQVVFQTIANGDIAITISEIPNSGTLTVAETFMNGVAGTLIAPIIRISTPSDTAILTDIAAMSNNDADAIAALIGTALDNNGYSVSVTNNSITYSRDLQGVADDIVVTVQTQGNSNLVDSQFTVNVTQQGRDLFVDPRVPNLDTTNWELLIPEGGAGSVTYNFLDTGNINTTLGVDFTVDNNNNVTATVDASGISGGTANTFMDTSNVGTTLGVDFSVSAANVVTATVDASNIPGGNVTPPERFLFTVSPRSISEGTGNQTVTVSGIGVVAPFTYTGFTRTEVHGPAGSIPTTPQSGTGTSFTFEIPRDQVGTYAVSFVIESENAAGVAQPNHTATSSVRVNADWYADALTTAPTALTDLTSRGAYNDGVSYRFPALVNGRAYIALPNSVASPRFRSGALFLTPMTTAAIGTTHMLYTLSADDYNGDGTLNVEVN